MPYPISTSPSCGGPKNPTPPTTVLVSLSTIRYRGHNHLLKQWPSRNSVLAMRPTLARISAGKVATVPRGWSMRAFPPETAAPRARPD
jgi:hypothetical protein